MHFWLVIRLVRLHVSEPCSKRNRGLHKGCSNSIEAGKETKREGFYIELTFKKLLSEGHAWISL